MAVRLPVCVRAIEFTEPPPFETGAFGVAGRGLVCAISIGFIWAVDKISVAGVEPTEDCVSGADPGSAADSDASTTTSVVGAEISGVALLGAMSVAGAEIEAFCAGVGFAAEAGASVEFARNEIDPDCTKAWSTSSKGDAEIRALPCVLSDEPTATFACADMVAAAGNPTGLETIGIYTSYQYGIKAVLLPKFRTGGLRL